MSRKLPAFVVALSLLAALPGVALAQTNRATLIDVHRITISKAKPGPSTANCSNQPANPGNGGFLFTGLPLYWTYLKGGTEPAPAPAARMSFGPAE